jgi:hypothetical protein
MYLTLDDGQDRYRVRIMTNVGLRSVSNFADFSFRTESTVNVTLEPGNAADIWNIRLEYEYLDRAEYAYPLAHKIATRATFVQFPPTLVGVVQTQGIPCGFKSFALGARVKGTAALCKHFTLRLYDANTYVPYFELQPDFRAYPNLPTHPEYTLVMPGEVQNLPASGAQGQVYPVGSVTAFGGASNEYQFSRVMDLTVNAETVVSFVPLDNAVDFANFIFDLRPHL